MEIIDFKDLGIMIPKDRVFVSFDISTSCIGVSIFNENFELTSVKALKMTTNKDCQDDPEITKGDGFKKFTFIAVKSPDLFLQWLQKNLCCPRDHCTLQQIHV